ncbi:phenylacetic acid degradation protein [Wenjunlia vitaminophila]|uniref:Phenylacetic acid degradation protein n=1 Tax=Wenjunlia vitaminophila TaxID=76728 RepID=A0A0T6LND7_WENVI|nr:1,2-phenylacetyl-CoA epoxidase subunit PaaC [Wenjunlia vitaminophila]KRV47359.1 phenylacetic acid degradation protein [Wenjunlia vitaminophila]
MTTARPETPAADAGPAEHLHAALALGDDALVLAQRLGEWTGNAPTLEEDVALTNIGLDLLGQARHLLGLVGDEDELAFHRDEREFRNLQLVEQPNGDFAHTIARQLYFSCAQSLVHRELAASDSPLAGLAGKTVHEVAYHRDHAVQWTLRLGDGTEESRTRMQRALDALWRYTGELFDPVPGLPVDLPALRAPWLRDVTEVVERATLRLPSGPDRAAWAAGGGRDGVHTEAFGRLLAEMQHLPRSHPGARW